MTETFDITSDFLNVPATLDITKDTPVSVSIGDSILPVTIVNLTKKEITVSFRPGKELTYQWSYRDRQWQSTSQLFGPTVLLLGACPLKK